MKNQERKVKNAFTAKCDMPGAYRDNIKEQFEKPRNISIIVFENGETNVLCPHFTYLGRENMFDGACALRCNGQGRGPGGNNSLSADNTAVLPSCRCHYYR